MVAIIYIEHDGTEHEVEVMAGLSLMERAIWNSVPGIVADCLGDCGCATCHVYLDAAVRQVLEPASKKERSTLRFALGVTEDSRLACQIRVTKEHAGLAARMPEKQY